MMLDLAQNFPPRWSKNTNIKHCSGKKQDILKYCLYRYENEITGPLPISEQTHPHSILQVPTTQIAKMSIDPKFVELTAGVVRIFS